MPPMAPKSYEATDVPSIVTANSPPSPVEPQDAQYWEAMSAEKT